MDHLEANSANDKQHGWGLEHQICSAQNILNSLNNEFSIFRAEQM